MALFILYIVLFLLFLYKFIIILNIKKDIKYSGNNKFNQKYIFLFPILEEQSIISSKLTYLKQLLKENIDIKFIFIISPNEKERLMLRWLNIKTTKEVLIEELKKFPYINNKSVIIWEHKNTKETKASKINYAINYIKKNYNIKEYIIWFFDFDSQINIDDYYIIDKFIYKNRKVKVFSTIPFPIFKNSNFIWFSSWFYQLERLFFKELLWNIEYCMWAGIFIRWSYFLDKLLPTFNDDIAFWYRLFLENTQKKIIKTFTYVTIPKKSFWNVKQLIPIYKAVFSYFYIMKQEYKCSIKNFCFWIYIIIKDISDIIETLIFLIIFILKVDLIAFIIIYNVIKSYIIYYLYLKQSNIYLNIFNVPIYYIFWKFLKFISFLYFIFYIIKYKNIYDIKTER